MLLALEREDRFGDRLACLALAVSLGFSSLGLSFVCAAAVEVFLQRRSRGWRRAYIVVASLRALPGLVRRVGAHRRKPPLPPQRPPLARLPTERARLLARHLVRAQHDHGRRSRSARMGPSAAGRGGDRDWGRPMSQAGLLAAPVADRGCDRELLAARWPSTSSPGARRSPAAMPYAGAVLRPDARRRPPAGGPLLPAAGSSSARGVVVLAVASNMPILQEGRNVYQDRRC